MKSQLLTALSVVGVLGTATTAMAVNTDTLASIDPGVIGEATDVLIPATDPSAVAPVPTATPAPADESAAPTTPAPQDVSVSSGTSTSSNPGQANPGVTEVVAPAPAPVAPVDAVTGGSGSRVTSPTDEHDDDYEEDHDEDHEEEDDDD